MRAQLASFFAKWLWKHGTWCSAVTQYNTHTKRQFSHLWQLVPRAITDIYRLLQTFKFQNSESQMHFKSNLVYNLKTKTFLIKISTLHYGSHKKLGWFFVFSLVFEFGIHWLFIVPNFKRIGALFAMLWLSNKCLFLVIQQAEVLLNFFWWV